MKKPEDLIIRLIDYFRLEHDKSTSPERRKAMKDIVSKLHDALNNSDVLDHMNCDRSNLPLAMAFGREAKMDKYIRGLIWDTEYPVWKIPLDIARLFINKYIIQKYNGLEHFRIVYFDNDNTFKKVKKRNENQAYNKSKSA